MTNRSEAAKRAWVTIRKQYGKNHIARKAWATRRMNKIMEMDQDQYNAYILDELEKEYNSVGYKRLRRLIVQAGGIKDKDYEDIPRWAKRKTGRTIDEHVAELGREGFTINSADDLYELIREVS